MVVNKGMTPLSGNWIGDGLSKIKRKEIGEEAIGIFQKGDGGALS